MHPFTAAGPSLDPVRWRKGSVGKTVQAEVKVNMLIASRWLLIIAGFWLIVDSLWLGSRLVMGGISDLYWDWPLPCPVTLLLLGTGMLLFGISSSAFKKV